MRGKDLAAVAIMVGTIIIATAIIGDVLLRTYELKLEYGYNCQEIGGDE